MIWNIPNILTLIRLAAAPAIIVVFAFGVRPTSDWIALILFVGASVTDWFDGYIARRFKQTSKFGAMLDPIADKAMVIIALAAVIALWGMEWAIAVPAAFILLREVFVSGLREFLGDTAGTLKVTKLAKWKTTSQMVAISVLLANGIFEHAVGMGTFGMDGATVDAVLSGAAQDETGLRWKYLGYVYTYKIGVGLLWLAALLTVLSGADYLRKAMPYLREDKP